jgi:hypothetical protein
MVTADCADMFEQFQQVKQLNTTAEITHNRKACFTCMLIQTYIRVLGHIPVSLKTAKYVKILNIKYAFYLRILSIHNRNTSSAIFPFVLHQVLVVTLSVQYVQNGRICENVWH